MHCRVFTKGISGCDQHSAYQYRDILFRHVVPSLIGILLLVHGDDHDSGGECDIGGECDGDSGGECDGVRIDCCG